MEYVTLAILVSFVWTCINILTYARARKLPPGPYPLPIFGNLFKLGNRPHESLTELSKSYGPLMTMKFGYVTTIVISSAAMAKEILHTNDNKTSNRPIPDGPYALNHHETAIAFLPVSPLWRDLRKLMNIQMFSARRLNESQNVRRQKVEELLAYVSESCRKGGAVNIGKAAFVTGLNLMSNTLFSIDLAHYESEITQEFRDLVWGVIVEFGRPNIVDYFPFLRPFDPQGIRARIGYYYGKLYEIIDGIIEKRLKARTGLDLDTSSSFIYDDFLDTLLNHNKDTDEKLSRNQIRDLLTDLFLAGSETTSTTIEWAMAELLRKPETMAKARLELEKTIDKSKPIQESDISRLPYLQAIVKETMRLHPSAPLLVPHKAQIELQICGFTVPKDAQILVNAWAIGRDSNTWTNPKSFVPERFLESSIDFRGQDFELIPFGAGKRICSWLPLAFRMVHLMLASLLYTFNWKLEDGMKPEDLDMKEKFGLTLKKAEPLIATPVKV